MKILLFLAKGFETMEASVFVDVFGWAKISYGYDVEGFEEYGFYDEAFSAEVGKLINDFDTCNKAIASVCVGALALAHSGILRGKRATTYHLNDGIRQKQLAAYDVEVINEPVVVDDNIITSYCPQTAPYVAFDLLEKLVGTEKMLIVKTAMGFE